MSILPGTIIVSAPSPPPLQLGGEISIFFADHEQGVNEVVATFMKDHLDAALSKSTSIIGRPAVQLLYNQNKRDLTTVVDAVDRAMVIIALLSENVFFRPTFILQIHRSFHFKKHIIAIDVDGAGFSENVFDELLSATRSLNNFKEFKQKRFSEDTVSFIEEFTKEPLYDTIKNIYRAFSLIQPKKFCFKDSKSVRDASLNDIYENIESTALKHMQSIVPVNQQDSSKSHSASDNVQKFEHSEVSQSKRMKVEEPHAAPTAVSSTSPPAMDSQDLKVKQEKQSVSQRASDMKQPSVEKGQTSDFVLNNQGQEIKTLHQRSAPSAANTPASSQNKEANLPQQQMLQQYQQQKPNLPNGAIDLVNQSKPPVSNAPSQERPMQRRLESNEPPKNGGTQIPFPSASSAAAIPATQTVIDIKRSSPQKLSEYLLEMLKKKNHKEIVLILDELYSRTGGDAYKKSDNPTRAEITSTGIALHLSETARLYKTNNPEIVVACIKIFRNLSRNDENKKSMAIEIKLITELMMALEKRPDVQEWGSAFIGNMALLPENIYLLEKERTVDAIKRALKNFEKDKPELHEKAIRALSNIADVCKGKGDFVKQALPLFLRSMGDYPNNIQIQACAMLGINSFFKAQQIEIRLLKDPEIYDRLFYALVQHEGNQDVNKCFLSIISEAFAKIGDQVADLLRNKFTSFIEDNVAKNPKLVDFALESLFTLSSQPKVAAFFRHENFLNSITNCLQADALKTKGLAGEILARLINIQTTDANARQQESTILSFFVKKKQLIKSLFADLLRAKSASKPGTQNDELSKIFQFSSSIILKLFTFVNTLPDGDDLKRKFAVTMINESGIENVDNISVDYLSSGPLSQIYITVFSFLTSSSNDAHKELIKSESFKKFPGLIKLVKKLDGNPTVQSLILKFFAKQMSAVRDLKVEINLAISPDILKDFFMSVTQKFLTSGDEITKRNACELLLLMISLQKSEKERKEMMSSDVNGKMIDLIKKTTAIKDIQYAACVFLSSIAEDACFTSLVKDYFIGDLALDMMKRFPNEKEIISLASRILFNVSYFKDSEKSLISNGIFRVMIEASHRFPDDKDLQINLISTLANFAENVQYVEDLIVDSSVIDLALELIKKYPSDSDLIVEVMGLLWNLLGITKSYISGDAGDSSSNPSFDSPLFKKVHSTLKSKIDSLMQVTVSQMKKYSGDAEIQKHGSGVLRALISRTEIDTIEKARKFEVVKVILLAMKMHTNDAVTQLNLCNVIQDLVSADCEAKLRIYEDDVAETTVKVMKAHISHLDILKTCCAVFSISLLRGKSFEENEKKKLSKIGFLEFIVNEVMAKHVEDISIASPSCIIVRFFASEPAIAKDVLPLSANFVKFLMTSMKISKDQPEHLHSGFAALKDVLTVHTIVEVINKQEHFLEERMAIQIADLLVANIQRFGLIKEFIHSANAFVSKSSQMPLKNTTQTMREILVRQGCLTACKELEQRYMQSSSSDAASNIARRIKAMIQVLSEATYVKEES